MVEEKRTPALVATPARRDAVIAQLQDHYAVNNLDVRDFEARVERAERARTDAELLSALDGLPTLENSTALVPLKAGQVTTTVQAVLGNNVRRGRWRVPARVRVNAWFGNVELDLSDAELTRGETTLDVNATFGSITITVPEGLAVECEGHAVLGSFEQLQQSAASSRDARVVRIVGRALLGSVEIIVKPRPPGVLEGLKTLLLGK